MKTWELIKATPIDCTMDNSGLYVQIHRRTSTETHKQYQDTRVFVRCDLLTTDDIPLVSFEGLENDVRKHLINWIGLNGYNLSAEHASYIGRELFRAVHDFNYIQS